MFRNQYDGDVTIWSPQGRLYQVICKYSNMIIIFSQQKLLVPYPISNFTIIIIKIVH